MSAMSAMNTAAPTDGTPFIQKVLGSEKGSEASSLALGLGHLPILNQFLRLNVHAWVKCCLESENRLSSKQQNKTKQKPMN